MLSKKTIQIVMPAETTVILVGGGSRDKFTVPTDEYNTRFQLAFSSYCAGDDDAFTSLTEWIEAEGTHVPDVK